MDADISSTQSTVSVGPSSSTELDAGYGSTSATVAKQPGENIKSTPVGSLSTDHNTESLKHETLKPSFEMGSRSSSQFAMQHATQALPSNKVSMATTSYTSEKSSVNQNIQTSSKSVDIGKTESSKPSSLADTSLVSIATESISVPKSVHPTKSISGDGVASKEIQTRSSAATSVSNFDSVTSQYEPSVSDTVPATSHQPAGQAVSVSLTSSMTVSSLSSGSSVKQPHVTSAYSATSRDLYHTMTPSKTEFSPSVLDSMSFKTTPVASLTLTPSVKPGTTSSGDSTPLFGGGTNDLLLYVAVPLCGVGLLVFLIICIVCIKRRKAKQKGSPGRHPVPDLWVNANAEVSLTPLDHRREIGLTDREALGGQRLSAVRKRYKSKIKENTDHMIHSSQKEAEKCHMTSKDQKEAAGGLIVTDIQGKDVCLIDDYTDDPHEVKRDDNDNKVVTDDPSGGCVTYEAMYDFPGELETHLTLRRGDVVQVHRKEDNGWWRGTIGDKTGWFPNGYVQAVLHDYLDEENEVAPPGGELNLSSFMVKRQSGANRHSLPTEDEIQAEPIYCKIQPKNRRKSEPKLDDKSPYKHPPQVTRENTPIPIDEGTKFVALYDYTAQLKGELTLEKGDILLGKEKDRNGWMHGVKEANGQEGWFPAVYVDEIVDKEEKPLPEENETKTKAEPDPAAYQHLEVNTKQGNDQDWVGILHKAIHTFTGEKAGDLHFKSGDMVTVFQVLENGWWLGCKDDVVGWFPGSYVEMVGHQSPKPKDEEPSQLLNQSESDVSTPNNGGQRPDNPGNSGKIRPVRKAPAPPDSSVSPPPESKIPKIARPNRKAPPPPATTDKSPVKEKTDHDHDTIHDPLYDVIGKKISPSDIVTNEQKDSVKVDIENISETPVRPKREKPKVPLRYVKPKIVTVPRNSVNLSDFHFEKEPSRSKISRPQAPPPPIPSPPKLISQDKSPANQNKDTLEHSISENEESDSFFNISPQKLFDAALKRQDSSDIDETQPYKSLSSFGSTFGKREAVSPSTSHDGVSKAPSDKKPTGIPKLSRQAVVEDEVSPTRNVIVHEELNNMEKPNNESKDINSSDLVEVQKKQSGISGSPNKDDSITKDFEIIKTPEKEEDNLNKDYSHEPSDVHTSVNQTNDKNVAKTALPVSRIPRNPGGDNVSRVPMSHGGKKKPETTETVTDMSHNIATDVKENGDHNLLKDSDDNIHIEHKHENSPQKHEHVDNAEKIASAVNGDISDTDRPRANSMEKPPVAPKPKPTALPKVLPKPKGSGIPQKKGPEDSVHDEFHNVQKNSTDPEKILNKSPSPEAVQNQPTSAEPTKTELPKVSKIPHGSKIAQKSPALKGKTSKILASPKVGRKNEEAKDTVVSASETDTENKSQSVNLKQKPESPGMGRKIPRHRTFSNESPSIRNRSNSPHSGTGIPSPAVRNRSNSPATKPSKPSGIKSPSGIPSLGSKSSGLPKKQIKQDSIEKSEPISPVTAKAVNDITDAQSSDELESGDIKPNRPSKPPRVQKQKSAESKPPKQGKSLLPVIHKSMDSGSPGAGGAGKAKTGIPMAKPPRPPQPKSPSQHHQDNGVASKKTLYQAVKGYTAQCEGELTFTEGTFIKELSDCDRAGWYVGMLADGTTGIYPADHLKPSPVSAQSEA